MKAVPLGLLGLLAVFGLPLLDPLTRARTWNFWVSAGFPILLVVVIVALVLAAGMAGVVPAVIVGVLGLGGLIFYANAREYNQDLAYASSVHITHDQMPTLKERAPFLVAERQASSSLSGINGTITGTDYLADSNTYSTLVDRNGPFNPGYAAIISQRLALTGQASGQPCQFDEHNASARMDGWWSNSLPRLIAAKDDTVIADKGDAWGYCDTANGNTPMIVVPLTKLNGFIDPIHVPAGVALYNGKTGNLEIRSEIKPGELPGPAVGLSQVKRINASLATLGGGWWSMKTNQSGLTDEVKDADDPNKDNPSAFSLAYKDQPGSVYVSPFTSRSSSRSIEDVELLESGHVKAGEQAAVTLYHLDQPRQSNAATADKIKATFSDLNGWSTGLGVEEVVPVSHNEWAASIGLKQNVAYRVLVKTDGSSCLANADGDPIRCVDASGRTVSGSQPGAVSSTDTGAPVTAVPSNVANLTNEDLAKLQSEVTAEVLRRLNKTK